MCYTALTIKHKKNTDKSDTNAIASMTAKMASNPDGYGIIGSTLKHHRTLDKKEGEKKFIEEMNRSKWILNHWRLKTEGTVRVENVHTWNKKGWYCTHNGTVSFTSSWNKKGKWNNKKGCYDYENGAFDRTDSEEFFDKVFEPIDDAHNIDAIIASMKDADRSMSLHGRTIMVNPSLQQAILYGDFEVYLTNSLVIYSSSKLSIKNFEWYGDCYLESNVSPPYKSGSIEGIYTVDLKNGGKCDYKEEKEKGYSSYPSRSTSSNKKVMIKGSHVTDEEAEENIYQPHLLGAKKIGFHAESYIPAKYRLGK